MISLYMELNFVRITCVTISRHLRYVVPGTPNRKATYQSSLLLMLSTELLLVFLPLYLPRKES